MRVLFSSSPGLGHFFPLVQLAWAFRADGHEVLVTIAEHAERAAAAGLEVVDVAPDYSAVAVFEQVARDHPDFAARMAARPEADIEEWAVQIAAVNRPMVERTMDLVDRWRPDLVVYDQGATVGLLAAARCGVPAVQRNQSAWRTGRMHEEVAAELGDLCERYALSVPKPDVTVESFPPSMLTGVAEEGWFMRWVPYGGGGVLGDRLPPPPERPRVAVTMGTIELQTFGLGMLEPILRAAADVPADFVLALGDIDVAELGPLPSNVTSVGWTPLHALLRDCSAVVHHGGGGTTLTAVGAGLPQLLTPDPRDRLQYTACNAVRDRGIGLVSTPEEVDPALLRRLLDDRSLRSATAEVRDEILSLPTPVETEKRIVESLF
ncbi:MULTISPECIES: nucleotide disphospho-sugar-binding domain-containing protein [unclassified Nocardiopsis]|uniref:nucleotide disphospho-sugar-binding domain-containing protein n=1 Tax=unclassified Nocardiopsis TaxID=2649073 RepID=UPI001359CD05|nr:MULTISPECIES: nucleotide disphospho-sugar-binding domain-containing protein [unclassified Nocardiopsis]